MRSARVAPFNPSGAADDGDTTSSQRPRRSSSILSNMKRLLGGGDGRQNKHLDTVKGGTKALRSPGGTFIGRTLSGLRKRLRRSPSRKYSEEQAAQKAEAEELITAEVTNMCNLLFDAKTIDSSIKSRLLSSTQGNTTDELAGKFEKILKMLRMLSMSRSTMHLRAVSRLLDDYEVACADLNKDEKKLQEETEAGIQRQKKRQNRRKSMADHHRRLSTIQQAKPLSFHNVAENESAVQEAFEHLVDLENSGILDNTLAERAKVLVEQRDDGTILTILKHSNNDTALRTYLQYRRTKTEDKTMKDKRRFQLSTVLATELQERTSLMKKLTSSRDAARSCLNDLDLMMDGTASSHALNLSELEKAMSTNFSKIYSEILVTAKRVVERYGTARHGASAKEAARAEALQSNTAIDLSDPAIKSFVRIRPEKNPSQSCVNRISATTVKCVTESGEEMTSTVDHIFPEDITQSAVFRAVEPMVLCTLSGFNATIFAYGSTGSGKTFTIVGENNDGIIPRSCSRIFEECKKRELDGFEHHITVAYLELYREKLIDLLSKPIESTGGGTEDKDGAAVVDVLEGADGKARLIFAKDRGSSVPLESLVGPWVKCKTASDVMALHHKGSASRAVGKTDLNSHSSRSHSILMINISSEGPNGATSGILTLVDLAGSENVKQSNVHGKSLGEAKSNNKSLAALGNVLSLLADNNKNKDKKKKKNKSSEEEFIPYRSNKLTHLLRDTLGGNAHALMITAVRKASKFVGQTSVSLNFAERARSIQNAVERNVENADLIARTER